MGVFAKSIDDPKFRDSDEEVVTLADLEQALSKIDYFADRQLDRLEFLLLALDRSLVFQKEYLQELYRNWSDESEGEVRVKQHIYRMMESQETSEERNWQKRYKLSEQLVQCGILKNPHVDDQITELQFLYICRDIFGLNTFDIEDSLPEIEVD